MDPARLRQQLRDRIGQVEPMLAAAFERTPILAGKVYVRQTRCGKPTCRCAQGALHRQLCLSTWRKGAGGTHAIAPEQAETLRRRTEDYRRLREARSHVRRWTREVLGILGSLERARRMPLRDLPSKSRKHRRDA